MEQGDDTPRKSVRQPLLNQIHRFVEQRIDWIILVVIALLMLLILTIF